MDVKYIDNFQSKSLQNIPKWGFWFKPSGNPVTQLERFPMSRIKNRRSSSRLSFFASKTEINFKHLKDVF
jgi:hypothetical protein